MSQTPRNNPPPIDPRLLELLADRAAFGLSEADAAELRALLAAAGISGCDSFNLTVAEAELAMMRAAPADAIHSPLPAHLAARLEAAAKAHSAAHPAGLAAASTPIAGRVGPQGATTSSGKPLLVQPSRATIIFPWLIAAASMALAVVAWKPWAGPIVLPTPPIPAPPTLAQQREQLLARPGTLQLAWNDFDWQGAKSELQGVKGDVVWSKDKQTGFMRFTNLPVNDPAKEQYQLWIIDERGLETRISGAVFSACSGTGDCIVKIDPAIPIREAALFAITIEPPGGVWVTEMKRRVVIAAKGS